MLVDALFNFALMNKNKRIDSRTVRWRKMGKCVES